MLAGIGCATLPPVRSAPQAVRRRARRRWPRVAAGIGRRTPRGHRRRGRADVGEYPAPGRAAPARRRRHLPGPVLRRHADPRRRGCSPPAHCVEGADAAATCCSARPGSTAAARASPSDAVVRPGRPRRARPTAPTTSACVHLASARPDGLPTARLAYEGLELARDAGHGRRRHRLGRRRAATSRPGVPVDLQEGDVPVISDDACDAALADYGDSLARAGRAGVRRRRRRRRRPRRPTPAGATAAARCGSSARTATAARSASSCGGPTCGFHRRTTRRSRPSCRSSRRRRGCSSRRSPTSWATSTRSPSSGSPWPASRPGTAASASAPASR